MPVNNVSDMPSIDESKVERFKRDLIGACPSLVTVQQQRIIRSFPDECFANVLSTVFMNDNTLARDIMYNRFDRINMDDVDREINKIVTLEPASKVLADAFQNKSRILVISDNDGDGDSAQSISYEAEKVTGVKITVEASDYDPQNHGFGMDQINNWVDNNELSKNDEFVVMVTDLGTNQLETQKEFMHQYPNAKLIIADHHTPEPGMRIEYKGEENKNVFLVSPHIEGSLMLGLQKGGGVSGGYLTYKLFKNAIDELVKRKELEFTPSEYKHKITPMFDMGRVANLIDGTSSHPALKPLRESDIKKALDISSSTSKGRSFGKWLRSEQPLNIAELGSLIGKQGVEDFLLLRERILEKNHMARALFDFIPNIIEPEEDKKGKLKFPNVPFYVVESVAAMKKEDSADVNYIDKLGSFMFNFSYENQHEGSVKNEWLDLASLVFKESGKIENDIIEKIREYKLVEGLSADHVTLSKSTSSSISKVFTTKQIAKSYRTLNKSVMLAVARSTPGEIILSYQSKVPMMGVMNSVKESLQGMDFELRGHSFVGGLTIKTPKNLDQMAAMKLVVGQINIEAKKIRDLEGLSNAVLIKPVHLPIVSEVFKKMRVHLESHSAPQLLMQVSETMSFEDKYSLKKADVAEIVANDEWGKTTESLDFAMTSSLTISNQALKVMVNEKYKGALSVSLMPNGSYITTDIVTGAQMDAGKPKVLEIPLQKERDEILAEYKSRFASLDLPVVKVPRAAAINALKFTRDGKKVFENTEAAVLGVLDKLKADTYMTLDVEGDGASNAACTNLGLFIAKPAKGSGTKVSDEEFSRLSEKEPKNIRNYRKIDGGYVVNERMDSWLLSVVIGKDGNTPLRVSLKAQNLTNMDQEFLAEGMSAEEAQLKIMEVLKDCGKVVVQAHNLPYDNNIIRVNLPEVYEFMNNAIHLDSAPLAKNHHIAYTNVQVSTVGKQEFFNAEHDGYNLTSLLRKDADFDFPSIKGGHVLHARGDDLLLENLSTRKTTLLKDKKSELADTLLGQMKPMSQPKFGIAKLLKMAAVHDLISHQPVKQVVKLEYETYGFKPFPDELWQKFQDNYAYDLTPAQNVAKFSVLPDVAEAFKEELKMDYKDVDKNLIDSRSLVSSGEYDPNVVPKTKKAQELKEKKLNDFKASDAFHANAVRFVNANSANAERFARSWVYEIVLGHHEPTTKDLAASFVAGVSDITGVDKEMVSIIYNELYIYKKSRNIKSYMVHETHNNVGLEGDVFQELNAFIHMLYLKLRNPYLSSKDGFKYGLNHITSVVEALLGQAADATLRQTIRNVSGIVLTEDLLNTYGAKQLDNFDESGISIANDRSGIAKMRCKTLSENKASVNIELPEVSAEQYRKLEPEERKLVESKIEEAVTVLLLSNSRKSEDKMKGDDSKIAHIIEKVVTDPSVLENLKEVQKMFGKLIPTQRDAQIKNIMKSCVDAILGKSALSIPINKHLPKKDLILIKESILESVKHIKEDQGFDSFLLESELDECFELAIAEFTAFENLRESGECNYEVDGYGPLPANSKRELTKTANALGRVLMDHIEACPDLANYVLTAKKDPMSFLIKSPLLSKLMKNTDLSPEVKLAQAIANEEKLSLENDALSKKIRR